MKRKLKGKRKRKAQGRSGSRKRSQCQKPFDTQSENAARGRVRRRLGEAWTRAGTKTVARPASSSTSTPLPPSLPLSPPLAFCRLAFGFVAKVLKAFAAIDSRLATLSPSPSRSLSSPSLGIFLEFHNNYNFVCVFACLGGGGGEGVPASAAGRKLCQPTKSWTRFTEYLWQHAWQVPFTVNSLPLPDHFHSFSDRRRDWGEAA